MNIFYKLYKENKFNHTTYEEWFDYGFESFCSLLHFLGYPPEEDVTFLKKYFTYNEAAANTAIMNMGDVADKIYYIISGKIKVSTQTQSKNITLGLFTEGNICASISEFFTSSNSAYTFESKSHLRFLIITKSNFDAAIQKMNPEKTSLIVQKLQQIFLNFVIEHQSNQSMALDVRIKNLYTKYPEMFNEFSDEDIASFLGIRRETYNRNKKIFFKQI